MDFVDGKRLLQMFFLGATLLPFGVVPLIAADIENDGGGFGRYFRREAVGVGLLLLIALDARPHLVLVMRAGARARNEDFPDPACAQAHGMAAAVPIVEIARDGDNFGVGRPDGEARAVDAIA